MEILKQNKQSVEVRLTPLELEILRCASTKELTYRRKAWNKLEASIPEELMYHAIMKDTSERLNTTVNKAIQKYRDWGVLNRPNTTLERNQLSKVFYYQEEEIHMQPCKRYTVRAMGVDKEGNTQYAVNYNKKECTNEAGNCGCIHAEAALLELMPNPEVVVVSHSPCLECAKLLVLAGVNRVYYFIPYRIIHGIQYLEDNGVEVKPLSEGLL